MLKEYMRHVENIYKEAGAKYAKAAADAAALEQQIKAAKGDRLLTAIGRDKKIVNLKARKDEVTVELQRLKKEADEKALEVRREVASAYSSRYDARADKLDMPTVELLKSGILTDKELIAIADTFKENATMRRLCGSYLAKSEDEQVQALGHYYMQPSQNLHLQAIDEIMTIGGLVMGGSFSGPEMAGALLDRWDEMAAPVFAAAPED